MITFIFVSNYISHHQIPFCEEMAKDPEIDFTFLQTEPMEEERRKMGWGVSGEFLPWLETMYDHPEDPASKAEAVAKIRDADMVLLGWTDNAEVEKLAEERLASGKPLIRMSERLYREGQWKFLSPRGLAHKYEEHTKWRNARAYLLCCGAYVPSDFSLIHAYPGKMFRWGYFPPLRTYTPADLEIRKNSSRQEIRILWAGRFLPLKHPEYALDLASRLQFRGIPFTLDFVGGGELEDKLKARAAALHLEDRVHFHGFRKPEEVRKWMEDADLFLFTSNHLEGWGAVLNEAMNSGCAVIAGAEAGAVPWLIRNGENGVIYNGEDEADFLLSAEKLAEDRTYCRKLGAAAYETIAKTWNAETAASRLLAFTKAELAGKLDTFTFPKEGPMSPAPVLKPYLRV